jgi:glycosyltransferase involved in cell wall biosynthesis
MNKPMNIAAVETFYGGSHRVFIDGLIRHSKHTVTLFSLEDKAWRWRLKVGAGEILQVAGDLCEFDLILVTSLCNVAELKALVGPACPPTVLYVHENQHTYPKSLHQKKDFQVEWIDFMNTVTADCVIYNSNYHRDGYHRALKPFVRDIPRTTLSPEYWLNRARERSMVLYPGTDVPDGLDACLSESKSPRILWNHRWEYDKQPLFFLETLVQCRDEGYDFQVILLGEPPSVNSGKFETLIGQLSDRILHHGYVDSREDYFSLLATCDIVVSTAIQENFGLSVVEAIQCGSFPILPNRLSYPELIPSEHHANVLYESDNDFCAHMKTVLENKLFLDKSICQEFMMHRWEDRIHDYDDIFSTIYRRMA